MGFGSDHSPLYEEYKPMSDDAVTAFLDTPTINNVPPLEGQTYQHLDNLDTYDSKTGRYDTADLKENPMVITSKIAETDYMVNEEAINERLHHKIVLDIDLPAQLIESTTPGHFHLYIDKEIPHPEYMRLLVALGEAGIIEEGYMRASLDRGYTAVRLPWIKKEVDNGEGAN
jgi:hypothetical protein